MKKFGSLFLVFLFLFTAALIYSQTAPVYFKFVKTQNVNNTHIIGIPSTANPNIKGVALKNGDEIGVFTPNGVCAGAVVWTSSGIPIIAYPQDANTTKENGFIIGGNQPLKFRIYSKLQKLAYYADVEFGSYPFGNSVFTAGGISSLTKMSASKLVSVEESSAKQIKDYALSQNYPNPFNPTTEIKYAIPTLSNVSLIVYDLNGKEINRLLNGETKNIGSYSVVWDGKNYSGNRASSGLYFYKIMAVPIDDGFSQSTFSQVKTMILMK